MEEQNKENNIDLGGNEDALPGIGQNEPQLLSSATPTPAPIPDKLISPFDRPLWMKAMFLFFAASTILSVLSIRNSIFFLIVSICGLIISLAFLLRGHESGLKVLGSIFIAIGVLVLVGFGLCVALMTGVRF